mgnify:CR=1 FL=1
MKKTKTLTYAKAKENAWDAFSKFIRVRDEADGCFTCGVKKPWKEMEAGHFTIGRHNSVLFDERNVHAQCGGCNGFLRGNLIEYYPKMLAKYGQKVIDEIKELNKQTLQLKVYQLVEIKEKYTELYEKLKDK